MDKPQKIWLTRPLDDSAALAKELATRGIGSIVAPLMRIEPKPVIIPTTDVPAAILLTSRHATQALATLPTAWRDLPIYCVGNATADAVATQQYNTIIAGESDILALLPRIATDLASGARLLYLAGEETRVDVAALLAVHHITVDTYVAYRAVTETVFSSALIDALTHGDVRAIALFSPRSAMLACELLMQQNMHPIAAHIDAYCLSLNVVEAAAALPWRSLHTCHIPTRAAMVDLIVSQMNKTL